MNARILLVGLGLAALLLLPLIASAQQASSASLTLRPFASTIDPSAHANTTGTLEVVMDATALANLGGIPVHYTVTRVPAWAVVTLSPASDIIYAAPEPSVTQVYMKALHLDLDVAGDAPSDAIDAIEITATVTPSAPGAHSAVAKATIPVHVTQAADAAAPACPTVETTAASPASTSDSSVTVQSAGPAVVPTTTFAAIGGFAAVGAGAGFLLRRRF